MDAQQEALIRTAQVVAAVLSRGSDLALVELTGKPEAVSQCTALIKAGFTHHGLAGITDGSVAIAPNDPLDVADMFAMGRAVRTLGLLWSAPAKSKADSVDWLSKLHALEDPRNAN